MNNEKLQLRKNKTSTDDLWIANFWEYLADKAKRTKVNEWVLYCTHYRKNHFFH